MSDPWEQIRHVSIDALVTQVKLSGSASMLDGFTTPEGWPFVVVVAVAKPGNEAAVQFAREFSEKMAQAAKWTERSTNPRESKP